MAGELVGEAFIRITADTTPMRRAVKRAAKEAGADYTSEFGKEVEATADARLRRARQNLADALVDPDGFTRMRKEFSSVEEAADNFRGQLAQLQKQGDLNQREMKVYVSAVNNWEKATRQAEDAARRLAEEERNEAQWRQREVDALKQFEASMRRANAQRKQEAVEIERELDAARRAVVEKEALLRRESKARDEMIERELAAARRLAVEREKAAREQERAENIEIERMLTAARAAVVEREKLAERETRAREKATHEQDIAFRSYAKNVETYMKRIERETRDRAGFGLTRLSRSLDNFNTKVAKSSDGLGRLFGKGSRNNFLNLFGRSIETLVAGPLRLLTGAFSGVSSTVGGVLETFRLARSEGASVFESLGKVASNLGSSLANSLPGMIALVGAAGLLAALLPALVSGLVLLGGALTAIAGALTLGVIGALLSLGPLLLAVVAGVGAVALAFQRAGVEGSRAEASVNRIKAAFKDFTNTAGDGLDSILDTLARNIPTALKSLQPLLAGAVTGIQTLIESFFVTINGPEVRDAFKSIGENLPQILGTLGSALGSLTSGLVVFFDEITPYTQKLLDGFDKLTGRFFKWVNSTEGKNDIADFMDTAWEAADKLWDILGNLTEAIGKVFKAGTEGAGQDFLDYLDNLITKFNDFLDTPEGKDSIQNFFSDVRDFMVTAKDALGQFFTALKELDTEQSRENFTTLVESIESLARALEAVAGTVDVFTFGIQLLIDPLNDLVVAAAEAYDKLFGHSYIPDIIDGFERFMPMIPAIITSALRDVFSFLTAPFRQAYTWLSTNVPRIPAIVGTFISSLPGKISGWLAAVPSRFSSPFSLALGPIGSRIGSIVGTVRSRVSAIPGAVSSGLSGLAGRFSSAFSTAYSTVSAWVSSIRTLIEGLLRRAGQVGSAVSSAISSVRNRIPFASGGVVYGPTNALIGEAGREAVVPLDRPLAMVDPSVRGLAAIAQGRASFAGGGVAGGRSIKIQPGAIVVQTLSGDPKLIAEMVFDRFASEARF